MPREYANTKKTIFYENGFLCALNKLERKCPLLSADYICEKIWYDGYDDAISKK